MTRLNDTKKWEKNCDVRLFDWFQKTKPDWEIGSIGFHCTRPLKKKQFPQKPPQDIIKNKQKYDLAQDNILAHPQQCLAQSILKWAVTCNRGFFCEVADSHLQNEVNFHRVQWNRASENTLEHADDAGFHGEVLTCSSDTTPEGKVLIFTLLCCYQMHRMNTL